MKKEEKVEFDIIDLLDPKVSIDDGEGTFRDSLNTISSDGSRKWVFPKKPRGNFHNRRVVVSVILIAWLFIAPFIKVNGHPLFQFDILARKFIVFGMVFWPSDFYLFMFLLLAVVLFVLLFTSAFGRIWCGWTCPQTVFMEMVFRKIEYWIEGDRIQQMKLAEADWDLTKLVKKTSKHALFLGIAFLIGNLFLAYIIGTDRLFDVITSSPADNASAFSGVLFFSGLFYLDFAFFREQFCHVVCPYGRFQSVLVDTNTVAVTYDLGRGEPRGRLRKRQEPNAEPKGDCIDCHACVDVCPAGIDIRNGIQLECVQCTACIDACDDIMDKVKKPRGLIRYTTIDNVKFGKKFKFSPRMAVYSVMMVLLTGIFLSLLYTRNTTEAIILRQPGTMYQSLPDGFYSNIYQYKIINKTFDEKNMEIRLIEPAGNVNYIDKFELLKGQSINEGRFFVKIAGSDLAPYGKTEIKLGLFEGDELIRELETSFVGPENAK